MRSSNPVLRQLGETAQRERSAAYRPAPSSGPVIYQGSPQAGYAGGQPTYPGGPQGYPGGPQATYPGGTQTVYPGGVETRAMNLDDVVTRTILLILLTGASAAVSWVTLRGGALLGLAMVGSSIAGLVLGLVIAFKRITNPAVIIGYAVLQGVLLGVVSRVFEQVYPGIVVQAVAATFGVFAAMAGLYKLRVLRATPKFTRFVIGALFGVVALSLLNWMLSMFGHNLGYEYYAPTQHAGTMAILFSLACIVIGALTFIIDFDVIESSIRYGLPERYAWYCAFGLLVGLIYLYWQILRLLGYLRR